MSDVYANFLAYHLRPISDLLEDPEITEVLINGPDRIFIEKEGRLQPCPNHRFGSAAELMAACTNLSQISGQVLDETRPSMDGSMPDGSRVHIIIPPLATEIHIAIRKFSDVTYNIQDLIARNALRVRLRTIL